MRSLRTDVLSRLPAGWLALASFACGGGAGTDPFADSDGATGASSSDTDPAPRPDVGGGEDEGEAEGGEAEGGEAGETGSADEGTGGVVGVPGGGGGDESSTGDESTSTSSGGDDSAGTTDGDCADLALAIEPEVPNVVLLIDQSGSMDEDFGDSTRWETVVDALLDENEGVLERLQSRVRFGLAMYTSHDGSAGGTCPMLSEVTLALDNYETIANVLGDAGPDGQTPTGESLAAVATALSGVAFDGPRIVVLATDGEPDTCAEPDADMGQAETVAAAEAAFAAGVETFVISVGADVSLDHLQDVANAGAGVTAPDPDAPYYQALDQDALTDAFEEIIRGVRSCVFALDGAVMVGQEPFGTVTINGTEIPYADPNGWRLNGPSEIEFLGTACDQILDTVEVDIAVSFPCEPVKPQ